MFKRILIANRGEIACRVIATARRMGVETVAVYADADANTRHVRLADQAVHIGASPARESYLDGAKITLLSQPAEADAARVGKVLQAIAAAIPPRFDRFTHPD